MGIRGPKYVLTPGDWQQVQIDLNDLYDRLTAAINVATGGIVIDHNSLSGLQGGSTGQYYHLTSSEYSSLGSLISGGAMVYPGAGIAVSTGFAWTTSITDNSANWNAAQPGAANLTALAGLAGTVGLVKQTSAGVFGIDGSVYLTSFTETDPVVKAIVGIVKSNGTTISAATAGTDYQSGTLTTTRIPFATGTPGTLTDDAALTFVSPNVIGTGYARFDGGLGIGIAPATAIPINISFAPLVTTATSKCVNMLFQSGYIGAAGTGGFMRGIDFSPSWIPTNGAAANRSFGTSSLTAGLQGGVANLIFNTASVTDGKTFTLGNASGYQTGIVVTGNTFGATTLTNGYGFVAKTFVKNANSVFTNCFAFYDQGQTAATNNWGIGINTANNYINGSLSVGMNTTPAYNIDVTGDINCTGAFRSGGTAVITATVTYVDTLLGAKTLTFTKGILTAQV